MRLSEITESVLTDELIDRLLFDPGFSYSGGSAGVIMVLGSRKSCIRRMPAAAEIFRGGGAPYIMVCGGRVQDTPLGRMTECQSMLKAAGELGVPREVIITEERSMTTEENFTFGGELLRERLPGCESIILVTAGFHMRRALLMAERSLTGYRIIPAAVSSGSCTAGGWKLTEKGRKTARREALKLGWYAKQGRIEDMSI